MPRQIDLDALLGIAGEVVVGGETHVVFPLDGAAYKIALRMKAGQMDEKEAIESTYEIAARCCPTLADRIETLTLAQVGALVALAGQQLKEVEELPKSARPSRPHAPPESAMEDESSA